MAIIFTFIAALFFSGLISRTKSVCSGRRGPGIFQPLKEVARLFRNGSVYSPTTGWVFKAAPLIYAASVILALCVIPFGDIPALISFKGDFVFFAYVLALGKFFSIIGALDTGSSFEGMGASREALYSMLAEPAFFLTVGSLALISGYTDFSDIFAALHPGGLFSYAIAFIAAFVIIVIELIENSRVPLDDPKTHLELTMIHEVMILDNSGFDLGLILSAGYLKFAIYTALVADIFIGGMPMLPAAAVFFAIQAATAVLIGVIESFIARFRMNHNPQFIFALTSVAMLMLFAVVMIMANIR